MGNWLPYLIVGVAGLAFVGTLALVILLVVARSTRSSKPSRLRPAEPAAPPPVLAYAEPLAPRSVSGAEIVSSLEQLRLQGAGRVLEDSAYATGGAHLQTLGITPTAVPPVRPRSLPAPTEPFTLDADADMGSASTRKTRKK